MNLYFDKPTRTSIITIVVFWLIMIISAVFFSGCKSRKVEKDYSKSIDKTEIKKQVSEKNIIIDNAEKSIGTNFKTEIVKDEETGSETTITTEYFEPSATIPPGSPKKKEEKKKESNKKQEQTLNELNDSTYAFDSHSQITELDSTLDQNNDIKEIKKNKVVDSKVDWIKISSGLGILFSILLSIFVIYKRIKK